MNNPTIILLAGPTCAGKTILESTLTSQRGFERVRSITTRAPRDHEVPGVDYDFVSSEEFAAIDRAGGLAEKSENPYGSYGVPIAELERVHGINAFPVMVVDPAGVRNMARFAEEAGWSVLPVCVFAPLTRTLPRIADRLHKDIENAPCLAVAHGAMEVARRRFTGHVTDERYWSLQFQSEISVDPGTSIDSAAAAATSIQRIVRRGVNNSPREILESFRPSVDFHLARSVTQRAAQAAENAVRKLVTGYDTDTGDPFAELCSIGRAIESQVRGCQLKADSVRDTSRSRISTIRVAQ